MVEHDLDTLMGYLGDFGRYQFWQFILHILSAYTAGIHMLSLVTVAAVPDHRCALPSIDHGQFSPTNVTQEQLQLYIPTTATGDLDSCHIYTQFNQTDAIESCHRWVYDTTYYQTSRAIQWDFVCERRWMGAIAQSSFMLGVFFGAVLLGNAADKYGRKAIFCWSALFQLIIGVAVAFIDHYYLFLLLRFLYGIVGSAGSYISGFVLTMELVGPSKRTVCGLSFQMAFALGIMSVAGWGALIHDRLILQVVYGLSSALLLVHWWLMDESPRWLWAQGRTAETVRIVRRALAINGSPITLNDADFKIKVQVVQEDSNVGMLDLFKTPNLRKKMLNICLSWFANSLVYYGLSLSTGKLYGNPYLILFLVGLVELPSYAITAVLLDRTGRRSLICFYMIAGGVCCIVGAELSTGSAAATLIVMIGKFLIASSFAIVYNYSAELFPTPVRNSAIGLGSMCARLSGTLTPLITLLDSFDPKLPAIIFALVALISGGLMLFLPETLGAPMPDTMEDGETFGVGDTCFTTGFRRKKVYRDVPQQEEEAAMKPLDKEKA